MSDPYVRVLGTVTDLDGLEVAVGVDYDSVTISAGTSTVLRFESAQADWFSALFTRACWEAGAQSARMEAEVSQ